MPTAIPRAVELVEVGPRDGLQNEARTLPIPTRVELITRLVDLGMRRIEAVSFVHPDRVPQMAGAEEIMTRIPQRPDVTYIGLVLNSRGARRATETACTEINVVVPVTDAFAERNQGAPTAALLDQAAGAVEIARAAGMTVSVTLAVAFGCPFTGEVPIDHVAQIVESVLAPHGWLIMRIPARWPPWPNWSAATFAYRVSGSTSTTLATPATQTRGLRPPSTFLLIRR